MQSIKLIAIFFFLSIVLSCSKNDAASDRNIAGTWIFTSQQTLSFPYPSVLTSPNAIATSTRSLSSDSIQITFSSDGNYTFRNFRFPIDNGSYSVVQDSLLVIKPSTSDFIKFNYTVPTLSASPGPVTNPPSPYAGFEFTTDTIMFKRSGNEILFTGVWLAKSERPLEPSKDTLIQHYVFSRFKMK